MRAFAPRPRLLDRGLTVRVTPGALPQQLGATAHLTPDTRTRLDRSLTRAFARRAGGTTALTNAVCRATRELCGAGLDAQVTLKMLGDLVEDAGRACGADRPSLISGEPRWLPIRTRVIETARTELARWVKSPERLMHDGM